MWEILSESRFKTHFRHFLRAHNKNLYFSFQSPHRGSARRLQKNQTNKQTNKRSRVHSPPPEERFRILSSSLLGMCSDWPATFNGRSLVIGRIKYWPLVLTWMTRTYPSWPGNTSSTRPRCHWPRGAFWSTTSTTSPTFRFSLASQLRSG